MSNILSVDRQTNAQVIKLDIEPGASFFRIRHSEEVNCLPAVRQQERPKNLRNKSVSFRKILHHPCLRDGGSE